MRIGVDIGGTFTDIIGFLNGKILRHKLLSTPHDPAIAVIRGVKEMVRANGVEIGRTQIVHGSTIAVNALLERKGARTALITTRGFEDIIEIGRQNRPSLYDLFADKPPPLVPSELRFGISERTTYDGQIEREVDESELKRVLSELESKDVESIAISLLHSYVNPENERRVGRFLERLGLHISSSHEVLPEYREYERTSTTVANAYIAPLMERYLTRLEGELGGIRVMQSSGGIISSRSARRIPIYTVMSGPAGGVVGASFIARMSGFKRVITFDMGGTSTDVSLYDGGIKVCVENEIGGVPVRVPMVEVHTVGAGGGSIAHLDRGGALRVGPQSAGADPGPVCYGRGDRITVTDANLILGRIPPEGLLGGDMPLDVERARRAMERFARRIGYSLEETCEGIIRVANATMEKAIRVISVERGYDPRDFAIISFGGAGGLHACELARLLSIPCVIVPQNPGLLSAFGMALADVMRDYSQTVLKRAREMRYEKLLSMFRPLEDRALREMEEEGFGRDEVLLVRSLDMRYEGQSYELTVPLNAGYEREFELAYLRRFGHLHPNADMEIVNLRLRAIGPIEKPDLKPIPQGADDPSDALTAVRELLYGGERLKVRIYDRGRLLSNNLIDGPAIITDYSGTTFIPPEFICRVDRFGNLIITFTTRAGSRDMSISPFGSEADLPFSRRCRL